MKFCSRSSKKFAEINVCSRRSKRIAHPKQYKNYLQEARQFDYMQVYFDGFKNHNKLCSYVKKTVKNWPQNAVNVDTLTDDMLPSQSQVCDHFHSEIEQVYI